MLAVAGGLSFTATWCFGQPAQKPSPGDVEVLLLRQWANAHAAVVAQPSNLSVSVESEGSNSVVVAPGAAVQYEVIGILSDDINEGLDLVGFDLDFDGGDLMQADTPTGDPNSGCENPMIHFTIPWGITNPAGYGGTIIGGDLIQVGGGQNTIKNTIPPFPIGEVLTGVSQPGGCGPAVLVTGTLTAPAVYGTYTLALENLFANVIREGETGAGPFWATEAAGIGTITNLTIEVGCTGSGPENTPGACTDMIDNDCDGLTDCADSDCFGEPACCGNGVCDALENECTCAIDCGTCIDCNGNGVPDDQDIANCDGSAWCSDCNANGLLDECETDELDPWFATQSEHQPFYYRGISPTPPAAEHRINNAPRAVPGSLVYVSFRTKADLEAENEFVSVYLGSGLSAPHVGLVYEDAGGVSCETYDDSLTFPADVFNASLALATNGGAAIFQMVPTSFVGNTCFGSFMQVTVSYLTTNDCNANTVPDECDIATCTGDPSCADCNANSIPDGCETDCNSNAIPDECDILAGVSRDTDANGIPDECEAGGCCDGSTGLCADEVPMALCTGDERSWSVNTLCAELNPLCGGACCDLLTGGCTEIVLRSVCSGAHQSWTSGATCNDVACEAVAGACCDHDPFGGCTDGLTRAECNCGRCEWTKLALCDDVECLRESIPTVGAWGLAILTLLLLTGAKVRFGRIQQT